MEAGDHAWKWYANGLTVPKPNVGVAIPFLYATDAQQYRTALAAGPVGRCVELPARSLRYCDKTACCESTMCLRAAALQRLCDCVRNGPVGVAFLTRPTDTLRSSRVRLLSSRCSFRASSRSACSWRLCASDRLGVFPCSLVH